jgi:hypothetical protein
MLGFLLRGYGRKVYGEARDFIVSMGRLYAFAAETYSKNFSTTDRPFYIARPRFFLIHLVDPHLICIPSLHVMIVIWTYTKFAAILRSLGEAEKRAAQIEEIKRGALAIVQAVLFVKQHSVNCISAALYAITCFDGKLFPPEEAEAFTNLLFGPPEAASPEAMPPLAPASPKKRLPNYGVRPCASPKTKLPAEDIVELKAHIIGLYRNFLAEGKALGVVSAEEGWEKPLLHFLKMSPPA